MEGSDLSIEPLTQREEEVLSLLAENLTNQEIANRLSLAISSVKWHTGQIFAKLGVENRRQAVTRARAIGLLASEKPVSQVETPPSFPSGMVTFLFTDIEGSTPLWEQMPQEMQQSIWQHHTILRKAIESNGGVVCQIIGDAFQAAFRLPLESLTAALAAQRALLSARWGATGPIKVRMGLHTGPAEPDPSGNAPYAANHTLNRAARIMSAGFGGQILLSQEAAFLVTRDLVGRELPARVTLKDLGEHHLKGMRQPEHLYQVVAPDLPVGFPALSSAIRHPNNLPSERTSFIGRKGEIDQLAQRVRNGTQRLLTLTGSGGTGKTRLALQVCQQVLEDFPDGIWLVELAPLNDPQLVTKTVAQVLGVQEISGLPILESLSVYLQHRRLLLMMDNCEHLLTECATLIDAMLERCTKLQVVATSREILNVPGESAFRVPSLALPDLKKMDLGGDVSEVEAVRLFVERAAHAVPGFRLEERNARAVALICSRLDGIPLAIELAAARVRVMPVEQIASRIDNVFRLLTGGARTVMPRQQTLKATIDWSYVLLSEAEKRAFQQLSVFAGGWTLEAAEAVCIGEGVDPDEVLDLLARLVDKSLVSLEQRASGEGRYRMLETIRQYAHDKLLEAGGGEAVRDRHLDYFLSLVLQAEPNLRSRNQRIWKDRLEEELDNLRLSLEWALSGSVEKGLQFATALLHFWWSLGHLAEGEAWLERLLQAQWNQSLNQGLDLAGRVARGRALNVLIRLLYDTTSTRLAQRKMELARESEEIFQALGKAYLRDFAISRYNQAKTWQDYQECRLLFESIHDRFWIAECDGDLSSSFIRADLEKGIFYAQENLALRRELGDADGEGNALAVLGAMELFQGNLDRGDRLMRESLACFQKVGNYVWLAIVGFHLCWITIARGNLQDAMQEFLSIQVTENELYYVHMKINWFALQAYFSWAKGQSEQALHFFEEALELYKNTPFETYYNSVYLLSRVAIAQPEMGRALHGLRTLYKTEFFLNDPFGSLFIIQALGLLTTREGQEQQQAGNAEAGAAAFQRAATLFAIQDRQCGWFLNILSPVERSEHQQALLAVHTALGETAFTAAWEQGQAMTGQQAVLYAAQYL